MCWALSQNPTNTLVDAIHAVFTRSEDDEGENSVDDDGETETDQMRHGSSGVSAVDTDNGRFLVMIGRPSRFVTYTDLLLIPTRSGLHRFDSFRADVLQ